MEVWFKCPHCGNIGDSVPNRALDKSGNIEPIEAVDVSAQWFECGRCKIESPSFVYVHRGQMKSHLVDEYGIPTGPGLAVLTIETFRNPKHFERLADETLTEMTPDQHTDR